ncbi:MAG: hypothetical protein AAB469_00145 [Patescibacteria group bacterium]
MIAAILVLFMVSFLIRHHHQCNDCLAAVNAMCDASEAFTDWRLRNQGVYIGLSEEGRLLLGRYLEAYDWFLRTHKFIDGTKHREWLVSMFYNFPPKTPHGMPSDGKKSIPKDALSFQYALPNA